MPLTGSVLTTAAEAPDRIAIADADRSLSYAVLVDDSRRLAAVIDAVHAGQPHPPAPARDTGGIPITAISTDSAFETSRVIAGLAGYRSVTATIDPRWPLAHRLHVIRSTGIGVVISDSTDLAAALRETDWGGTILSLDSLADLQATVTPAGPPTVRDGDEPFLMLFSSGTTSNPKAFIKTREQYRQNFAVSSAHLEPLPGVATLAPGPVSYSLTLYAVIECLASGGSVHVADAFDPIAVGRTAARHRITRVVAVPAMVAAIAAAASRAPERFASLELVVTGGASLGAAIRATLRSVLPAVRLISYYGAAEIGFIGDSRSGDGSVIDLYDGIAARIRHSDGSDIPTGANELDELWIRAAACSAGYVEGTSTERLVDDEGWATVHDQAHWIVGAMGRAILLAGRAGDIAITAGHKVSLAEVDRAFEGAPGIGGACAIALDDDLRGQVVALVVEANSAPTRSELTARAREHLAPQFVPRRFFVVDRLPRTVGGKVRRAETAALVAGGKAVRL